MESLTLRDKIKILPLFGDNISVGSNNIMLLANFI